MSDRVLVVGGTGALGTEVRAALEGMGVDTFTLARRSADVAGDVTQPRFGLNTRQWDALVAATAGVVWCPGKVDWTIGPQAAMAVHQHGTRNLIDLLDRRRCRCVYVSSVLVLGTADGPCSSCDLHRDQDFRNWYEYGKYSGEVLVRDVADLDVRVLRFGPLVPRRVDPELVATADGLLAAVRFLCQGYPVHLDRGGDFPAYVGSMVDAANVVAYALAHDAFPRVSTWVDRDLPPVRAVLTALCSRLGTWPKILDAGRLGRLMRLLPIRGMGLAPELLAYAKPLPELDLGDEASFEASTGRSFMATAASEYLWGRGS